MKKTPRVQQIVVAVALLAITLGATTYPLVFHFHESIIGGGWLQYIPSWFTLPLHKPIFLNSIFILGLLISEFLYYRVFLHIIGSWKIALAATLVLFAHPWIAAQYTEVHTLFLFYLFPLHLLFLELYRSHQKRITLLLSLGLLALAFLIEFDWGAILLSIHIPLFFLSIQQWKWQHVLSRQWAATLGITLSLVFLLYLFLPANELNPDKQFKFILSQSVQAQELFTPYHHFSSLWSGPYTYLGILVLCAGGYAFIRSRSSARLYGTLAVIAGVLSLGPWLQTPLTAQSRIPLPYHLLFSYLPFHSWLRNPSLFFLLLLFGALLCIGFFIKEKGWGKSSHNNLLLGLASLVLIADLFTPSALPSYPLHSLNLYTAIDSAYRKTPGAVINFQKELTFKPLEQYFIDEIAHFRFAEELPVSIVSPIRYIFELETNQDIFPALSENTATAIAEREKVRYFLLHKTEKNYQYFYQRLTTLLNTIPLYEDPQFLVLQIQPGAKSEKYISLDADWSSIRRTREQQRVFRFVRSAGGTITFRGYEHNPPKNLALTLDSLKGQHVTIEWKGHTETRQEIHIAENSRVTITIPWVAPLSTEEVPQLIIDPNDSLKVFPLIFE